MDTMVSFWLFAGLLGVLFFALAVQTWYLHQLVRGLLEFLRTLQEPSVVLLAEVSQVESRLKTRLEEVESLVAERLTRSNELAEEAARSHRSARSAEERTRRHADRAEEAEFADGDGAQAPWDLVAAGDEAVSEAVVAPNAPSIAAWAFNRRRS